MEKLKTYFKIMDLEDGNLKTLFHGVDGSRTIPQFEWVQANMKVDAKDGTSKSTYTSGWHVIETQGQCEDYLRKFKILKHRVIVKCQIKGLRWKKEHSPAEGLWLAEYIKILEVVKLAQFITREEI